MWKKPLLVFYIVQAAIGAWVGWIIPWISKARAHMTREFAFWNDAAMMAIHETLLAQARAASRRARLSILQCRSAALQIEKAAALRARDRTTTAGRGPRTPSLAA
jgi:hypothetical protein